MGVYKNLIEPFLLAVEKPFFLLDAGLTQQMVFDNSTGVKRLASYTCPYSGIVFSQPTPANMPRVLENGDLSFDGSQWLECSDKAAFTFMHNGEAYGSFLRFRPRGENPNAHMKLYGDSPVNNTNIGTFLYYSDVAGEGFSDGFWLGITRGTSSWCVYTNTSSVVSGYTQAQTTEIKNNLQNRFTPNQWNTACVSVDSSSVWSVGANAWHSPSYQMQSPSQEPASFNMRLGSIGGTLPSSGLQGEFRKWAIYKRPLTLSEKLHFQQTT